MDKVHYAALWGRADSTQVRAASAPLRKGERGGDSNPSSPAPRLLGIPGTTPGKSYPTGREPHPRRGLTDSAGRTTLTRAPPAPAGEPPAVPASASGPPVADTGRTGARFPPPESGPTERSSPGHGPLRRCGSCLRCMGKWAEWIERKHER